MVGGDGVGGGRERRKGDGEVVPGFQLVGWMDMEGRRSWNSVGGRYGVSAFALPVTAVGGKECGLHDRELRDERGELGFDGCLDGTIINLRFAI